MDVSNVEETKLHVRVGIIIFVPSTHSLVCVCVWGGGGEVMHGGREGVAINFAESSGEIEQRVFLVILLLWNLTRSGARETGETSLQTFSVTMGGL